MKTVDIEKIIFLTTKDLNWIINFVLKSITLTDEPSSELHSSLPHQAMETYMCSNDHKCYAIRNATHELYLLFAADVPNYALG